MLKNMLFCIVCLWLEFICIQDFYLEKVFLEKKTEKKKRKENPSQTPPHPLRGPVPFPDPARAQPRPQRALPSLLAATISGPASLSL